MNISINQQPGPRLTERWRRVPGFPGVWASSHGNLKRRHLQTGKWKVGPGVSDGNGYLCFKQGAIRVKSHRLVAAAFIPNPNNFPQVNHINGIPTDNRPQNLEWCTGSENVKHAYRIGLISPQYGESHGMSVLTDSAARQIYFLYNFSDITNRELGRMFSISPGYVSDIGRINTWGSVNGYFSIKNMRIFIQEDNEKFILMISDDKMTAMPAGPRLFRTPHGGVDPEIRFIHATKEEAEKDAEKLNRYLAETGGRQQNKKQIREAAD